MSQEPTNVEKMRGLPWSLAGESANTIFAQFTFFGSAFVLFLSALQLSNATIGLILSLFPFFGLIAPLIAPAVARFGYKRTFITFWGTRKIVTAFILLTPWVLDRFGSTATLVFVGVVTGVFALCRALGEIGKYPWTQEYVPNAVRGRYAANSNLYTTITGLGAVTVAGYVIDRSTGLSGYMLLIGAGVFFGLIAVWAYSFIPGGGPVAAEAADLARREGLSSALRDRGFFSYLVGFGLVTVATVPVVSFLPLFMQEEVGLTTGQVVLLQNGTLVGTLLSAFIWGWAADRYGSNPVMLTGVSFRIILPLLWALMPRHAPTSIYVALVISLLQGIANTGWAIGSARLLFVSIVPPEKKSDYMALYYAWIGVTGGISQLIGGWILDLSQGATGRFLLFPLDPYSPLFLLGFTLPILSLFFLRNSPDDSEVSVTEFAGIFLRGNPFQAMGSMFRYYRAKDEHATVIMTERLGRSGSALTVEELLEALADPRFNVRFEAVVSVSRMRPDPRLTDALVEILDGTELALSVVAAWALGRIGDDRARRPLQMALDSDFRSIQVHSARALGALGDQEVAQLLLERLASAQDKGLQMAYASALGQLRYAGATGLMLDLLNATENEGARLELALALARIVGDEQYFIQLLRQFRAEMGTAASQAVSALHRKWPKDHLNHTLTASFDEAAKAFARGELARGARYLSRLIGQAIDSQTADAEQLILDECIRRLDEFGASHVEYLLLALHTLNCAR